MNPIALAQTSVSACIPTLSQILRERRDFVSQELERVCHETIQPRILSVHNGFMREAGRAVPLCAARGGQWVAIDDDLTRLAELKRDYGSGCVRYLQTPGFSDFSEETGTFHFAYTLNRMAELNDRAARQELARLRRALRKGGAALVSCFTPESAHLYWNGNRPPFLRNAEHLASLTEGMGRGLRGQTAWCDEFGMVAYLQLEAA